MEKEPRQPLGFFQFPGVDVDGVSRAWFVVEKSALLGNMRADGNRSRELEATFIPEVVQNPGAIYEGLQREGTEYDLAYVGTPAEQFHGDRSIASTRDRRFVFVVYISGRAADGQYKIRFWESVKADASNPGLPVNHAERYGRELWRAD